MVNGQPARSCTMPISKAAGASVTTLEGLGTPEKPSALQVAFIAEGAAQCGYCTNGMIMAATAFLKVNKAPTEAQIKTAMTPWLCRCGTHFRIVSAVQAAAKAMA
jgi:nicotinate dehydrogenase subunit A